jgi:hypothetical protein
MDVECVELCRAVNDVPGLRTTHSCCGHGKEPFRVWLEARNVRDLLVLGRAVDRRYTCVQTDDWRTHGWKLLADVTDSPEHPVWFTLESTDVGGEAYRQAALVAHGIFEHLEHGAFAEAFGVGSEQSRWDSLPERVRVLARREPAVGFHAEMYACGATATLVEALCDMVVALAQQSGELKDTMAKHIHLARP